MGMTAKQSSCAVLFYSSGQLSTLYFYFYLPKQQPALKSRIDQKGRARYKSGLASPITQVATRAPALPELCCEGPLSSSACTVNALPTILEVEITLSNLSMEAEPNRSATMFPKSPQ